MKQEEIKNSIEVSSRLKYIEGEQEHEIVDFIINYAFEDHKEIYTNGTILVPLYRVLDAIIQKGKPYQSAR